MKRTKVVVTWEHGLHLGPAARLVRLTRTFRSAIRLRLGDKTANLRSILSLISLCAVMGTVLELEAAGEDEDAAVSAVERAFNSGGQDNP